MKWKTIPSCPFYEASDCGKVRSKKREVNNQPKNKKPAMQVIPVKILKPKTKKNGYLELSLTVGSNKARSKYVHRLVAETWFGTIPENMTVNHIDGDKNNNHIKNLEVVSHKENIQHAHRLGLMRPTGSVGSKHPRATTNENEVLLIRKLHKELRSIKKLVSVFPHISKSTLGKIVYRSTWKHI